jgi:DNA-binding response OmpR family regulator
MAEQKRKLLVVDDEEAIGQVLKAGLEMHGFTVRFEARSTDTIKACLKFHPDLVLLDVDMPVKDGGEVASELQSHPTLRRTPVVFLSSLVTKEETGKRNASREIFLSKQIPIADLVARIRAVLQPETRLHKQG